MEAVKLVLSVFSRQQKLRLLPFVVSAVFFLIQPYPTESFIGVILKIIPDFCLIAYVMMTRSRFPLKTKSVTMETLMPEDVYSFFILIGLVLSVVGDILVVVPALLVPGGIVFILVHTCYYIGIELSGRHQGGCDKKTSWFFFLLFINTFLCVQSLADSYMAKILIFVYFIFLFGVGWKSAAAVEENPGDKAVMFGCIGACLFILTDAIIFSSLYGFPIPAPEFIFMVAYYGAQFGWAVSTSNFT